MGRRSRDWYTYRTAVAIVLAAVISLAMFALYTQQIACDNLSSDCHINVVIHPEDRLFGPAVRT